MISSKKPGERADGLALLWIAQIPNVEFCFASKKYLCTPSKF